MSQEELAHLGGFHRTYVSDIERGARNIALMNLVRLSTALRLQPSDLLVLVESHINRKREEPWI